MRVFITNVKGTFLGMSESEEASKRHQNSYQSAIHDSNNRTGGSSIKKNYKGHSQDPPTLVVNHDS